MNKEEYLNLLEIGKTYVGKVIPIKIPNPNNLKTTIVVDCTVTKIISTIGLAENGEEMKYKSPICEVKLNDGSVRRIPLTKIINI